MKKIEEKRRFRRVKKHHLMKYRLPGEKETLSFVREISAGGILFHSREMVETGMCAEARINFPLERTVTSGMKIVRSVPLTRLGGFNVGAEFTDIGHADRTFIGDMVNILSAGEDAS